MTCPGCSRPWPCLCPCLASRRSAILDVRPALRRAAASGGAGVPGDLAWWVLIAVAIAALAVVWWLWPSSVSS